MACLRKCADAHPECLEQERLEALAFTCAALRGEAARIAEDLAGAESLLLAAIAKNLQKYRDLPPSALAPDVARRACLARDNHFGFCVYTDHVFGRCVYCGELSHDQQLRNEENDD